MLSDVINNLFTRMLVAYKDEDGQTFVEYGLIAVLVGLGLTVALTAFAGDLSTMFGNLATALGV